MTICLVFPAACGIQMISALYNQAAAAEQSVPAGFNEFFVKKPVKVNLIFNDKHILVSGLGTVETFWLDQAEQKKVTELISSGNINAKLAAEIAKDLIHGVQSSPDCSGRALQCELNPENVDYIYGLDSQFVKVVAAANLYQQTTSGKYISQERGKPALIVTNSLYASKYTDSDFSFNYSNESTLGLGAGYLYANFDVSNNSHDVSDSGFSVLDLSLDELSYNYLFNNNRFRVGYLSDRSDYYWSSTAFLQDDSSLFATAISFGSTSELRKKDEASERRLYFSSPINGRYEILRDNKVIVGDKVKIGQNHIVYSRLPNGIYNVKIKLYGADGVVSDLSMKIYNLTSASEVGTLDYMFTLGKLDDLDLNLNEPYGDTGNYDDSGRFSGDLGLNTERSRSKLVNQFLSQKMDIYHLDPLRGDVFQSKFTGITAPELELENSWFFESDVSTQLTQGLLLGLSFMNTRDDFNAKLAASYQFSDNLDTRALVSFFDDASKYYSFGVSFYGLNLDYSQYNSATELDADALSYSLADYRYGLRSYKNASINYNKSLLGGNFYLTGNKGEQSKVFDSGKLYEYYNVNLGYNYFFDNSMSLDVSLGMESGMPYSDLYSVAVNVTVPLGMNGQANFSGRQYGNDFYSYRTAYTQDNIINKDGITVNGEVGATMDAYDGEYYDAALHSSYDSDSLSAGLDVNTDSNGQTGLYGSLQSTQIFDGDSLYSTRDAQQSYIIVNNHKELESSKNGDELYAVAVLKKDGAGTVGIPLNGTSKVIATPNYHDYSVAVDTDASDYSNGVTSFTSASSRPGQVIELDSQLYQVENYISVFEDLEGQTVADVKCVGEGCVAIEEVIDGVYKFKIKAGYPYKLIANNQRCYLPENRSDGNNLGENFCMPEFVENQYGIEVAEFASGNSFYYVGSFNDTDVIDSYSQKIMDLDTHVMLKKLGKVTHVFVKSDKNLTADLFNMISAFKQYALVDKDTLPYAKAE